MSIVVDLGCFPHRDEISIEPLLERYRPTVLYGFDPWPGLVEGETEHAGTRVVLARKAAWIEDGEVEFARVRGLRGWDSTVMRAKNAQGEWTGSGDVIRVPCFDFSSWLRGLPEPPIVKLDVEGAEFPILEKLVEDGSDALVSELLVEWHDTSARSRRAKGDSPRASPLPRHSLGGREDDLLLDDPGTVE